MSTKYLDSDTIVNLIARFQEVRDIKDVLDIVVENIHKYFNLNNS